ncbi:Arylsulfatase [Rubripirellula lacrimiformis]|uniref:Arylsulfatase n=1 Tax=Rubripirellula lacrimiformis TaxID=1930273 RepID=A0A517N3Y3_9BACT|nr:sulfatase-like hydrolase/transferase [Rubripirellula lacrimiformis]QDT01834.1 Arylsulfatase [Rubripirellula lacrimiformis]
MYRSAASLLFVLMVSLVAAAADRPNIVLIFSDDQGVDDVGCYGSEIPTPNIDRIAKQGIRLTNWYSASSICTPSRYGLLTGRNPSRSRDQLLSALMFLSESDAHRGIHSDEQTIAGVLGQAGYTTALFGKWHLGHGDPAFMPMNHGFQISKGHTGGCIDYFTMTYGIQDDWYEGSKLVPKNGYATELITEEATEFLESQRDATKPFFLYLPYNAPHFGKGWNPSKGETVNIMQAQAKDLQRVASIRDKVRREFAAMVVSLDDGVGRVMQSLDQTGLADNTLLIFLTDHGGDPTYGGSNRPLRGDKATLFEGGLKVPCVMRWPQKIQPGTESDAVLSSLDLFPTFCEVASVDVPASAVDGQSLLKHLVDGDPVPSRDLFWQTGQHAELDRGSWTALRRENLKYIQDQKGREYLFDLKRDPNEEMNLRQQDPVAFDRMRGHARQLAGSLAPKE